MNASPRSSPTKMNTYSTPDDSPREDEHDWDSYLIETNSEAAPANNFKQASIPPVNEFIIGEKLESIDPRNQDSWCIGTIIEKDGPRVRIRLDGTDDRNDFWRLVDSTDIRCYGTTAKYGGQIVPPLGFQLNSTRWSKYFERNVKDGPFAAESCFKPQPSKPEKNLFKKGQKLETVDPRHPHVICPATVNNVMPGDHRIMLSLDGWSSLNNFKIDYSSRDIFPVGWCQLAGIRIAKVGGNPPSRTSNKTLPKISNKQHGNIRQQQSKNKKIIASSLSNDSSTTMDEKNNNLTTKRKTNQTSKIEKENGDSMDLNETNENIKKKQTIVTVYLNYLGDNSGMLLNPQKFRSSMPSTFGPDECHTVLTSIFDACMKCAFQQASFIKRILDQFPIPKDEEKDSYIQMKLENGTIIYVRQLKTEDDFWDVIRILQNGILSGNDLFISTPPLSVNNQSDDSSTSSGSYNLHYYLNIEHNEYVFLEKKKDLSQSYRSINNSKTKRKSTELASYPENKTFISNGKAVRSSSTERTIYDTKPSSNTYSIPRNEQYSNSKPNPHGYESRHIERFTPSEVAAFVRGIDPSFDSLASRFLQEEIDGKALLLLTTDTLMRHMGLKLGPSLKIVHHIEQLKKC
ncbi:unnamed protein product [Rotaria sordida]|uniref:SAM domain-containing protein n=1 Tax=Rotaria sordida TaxID=392033 RepID=A0A814I3S4_9BILA|nr:unnamed protein product [Rotaria sordida]